MRPWLLIPLALPLLAAAPQQSKFSLGVPADSDPLLPVGPQAYSLGTPARGPVYEPAPLPNRDVSAPKAARASSEPTLARVCSRPRTSIAATVSRPNSSAQAEQEKRVKPGAGFSLHMPLAPQ